MTDLLNANPSLGTIRRGKRISEEIERNHYVEAYSEADADGRLAIRATLERIYAANPDDESGILYWEIESFRRAFDKIERGER